MRKIVLFCSIALASGLLFANTYNSLIDARSWSSDIPASIETARQYFKAFNPGMFYRVLSPINQVLALAALILFWRTNRSIRVALGISLALFVITDIVTFAYFYPRNDLLFFNAPLTDIELLKKTAAEWSTMNWVRNLILATGVTSSFFALNKFYTSQSKS